MIWTLGRCTVWQWLKFFDKLSLKFYKSWEIPYLFNNFDYRLSPHSYSFLLVNVHFILWNHSINLKAWNYFYFEEPNFSFKALASISNAFST